MRRTKLQTPIAPSSHHRTLIDGVVTLAIGAAGFLLALVVGMPIPALTGPAIAVSLAGLAGVRLGLATSVRDIAFVTLGVGIGSGMTEETTHLLVQLPLVLLGLGVATAAAFAAGWWLLRSAFGYDRRTALLAASPGHLSFVLSMGALYDHDLARITVVQSIRLLSLTLITPLVAAAWGIETATLMLSDQPPMIPMHIALLMIAGTGLGLVFARLRLPAPLLIGAMVTSMFTHATGLIPGSLPNWLAVPAFVILGTLIGTRFGNISLTGLRRAAAAGLATTLVETVVALTVAVALARMIGLPVVDTVIAFAPGGFETMIAMGLAVGAMPGFVAACHLGRLLFLTFLVPAAYKALGPEQHGN